MEQASSADPQWNQHCAQLELMVPSHILTCLSLPTFATTMSHFLGMSNASIIILSFYSLLSILRQNEILCICIGVHLPLHMLDPIRNWISRHPVLVEFLSCGLSCCTVLMGCKCYRLFVAKRTSNFLTVPWCTSNSRWWLIIRFYLLRSQCIIRVWKQMKEREIMEKKAAKML